MLCSGAVLLCRLFLAKAPFNLNLNFYGMNLSFFVAWFSSFLRLTRLRLNFLCIISVYTILQRHFLFQNALQI